MAESDSQDADLLTAARAGSKEALGQVLESCRAYLLLVAERELGDDLRAKGGASDLVQEAFLEAHKDFERFHGGSEPELRAWLRALLLHRLANFARRYRYTQKRGLAKEVALQTDDTANTAHLADDVPTPSVQMMASEQAAAVERLLERLPEDYRRAILLRYREQLPFEEIGRLMGRSAEAARKLWWRALERLQQELETPS
ncbi:MAG TPA: sigma-70 family RNA polymerase sigma factor [Gemmataceae bacterium]|nr:sigma-70 family RNA polymerase sigma factor [Gemmataceae bacterium]